MATAFTLARILSNIPPARGGPTSLVIFDIHALQVGGARVHTWPQQSGRGEGCMKPRVGAARMDAARARAQQGTRLRCTASQTGVEPPPQMRRTPRRPPPPCTRPNAHERTRTLAPASSAARRSASTLATTCSRSSRAASRCCCSACAPCRTPRASPSRTRTKVRRRVGREGGAGFRAPGASWLPAPASCVHRQPARRPPGSKLGRPAPGPFSQPSRTLHPPPRPSPDPSPPLQALGSASTACSRARDTQRCLNPKP